MTLILSCLTKNTVFQISDRRLTNAACPSEVLDDERNKAVVVDGRIVFGYTGLSEIRGEKTDDWLARIVSKASTRDMSQVACQIRDAATEDFGRMRLPSQYKYQAFQGAGWFRLKGEEHLCPGIVTIDNGIDHQTGSWLPAPMSEFRVSSQFPSKMPGECVLNSVGFTPSIQEKSAIVRLLRKCVKHRRATPHAVQHALIISMRWLSSRNPTIGPGLMAVCLPKKSVEKSERTGQLMMLASAPNESTPTFVYVSATGLTTWFGPHFVGGGSVITGFQCGSL